MNGSQKSHLEQRLETLDALYAKFGRDGLKDQPLAEVNLLLASKQLQVRDTPKGDNSDQQKEKKRLLEMQVLDLTAHVNGQVAGIGNRSGLDLLRSKDGPKFQQSGNSKGYER